MVDRHAFARMPDAQVDRTRFQRIESPREAQGVIDSLTSCYGVETVPEEIRKLLSRLR